MQSDMEILSMLYNTITFIVGMAVGVVVFIIGYNRGLTINSNLEHNVNRKKPTIKQRRAIRKLDKKQEEESRRYQTILDNIDAYNGTAEGQKEVK